jgi:hypothetical protein
LTSKLFERKQGINYLELKITGGSFKDFVAAVNDPELRFNLGGKP